MSTTLADWVLVSPVHEAFVGCFISFSHKHLFRTAHHIDRLASTAGSQLFHGGVCRSTSSSSLCLTDPATLELVLMTTTRMSCRLNCLICHLSGLPRRGAFGARSQGIPCIWSNNAASALFVGSSLRIVLAPIVCQCSSLTYLTRSRCKWNSNSVQVTLKVGVSVRAEGVKR